MLRLGTQGHALKIIIALFLMLVVGQVHSECTILLHGLVRTADSMVKLETALSEAGYRVINLDYASREAPIEVLAEEAVARALKQCPPDEKVNFVTHSLGGILVRQYFSDHLDARLNRVVMLGPPNQGSEVVDKLADFPGFALLNGDAGLQLGTGKASVPNSLGAVNFDLGIIAGTRSINFILSSFLPDPDDGKVSVARTRVAGMKDHIEMPVTHPFMMSNGQVIKQVIYYLEHGSFSR